VFAADTMPMQTTVHIRSEQQFINLRPEAPVSCQPPVDTLEEFCSPEEQLGVDRALAYAAWARRIRCDGRSKVSLS